ncbi:hypothetical protein [Gordonia humi]|uniref:Uncharacterized protein n=1 Tax=Gordonia humi TaxID=686429 RepID=A0A840F6R5_9ACTN|nr:hypothetical protein [Gordonia humi]MBB4137249.1 hypothetical protein [Gordonia humi]
MAPSGEHRPEKLGQAEVRAAAIATGNAATVLRERVTSLSRVASGKTVNEQLELITQQAGIAEKVSKNLGVVADALKIREDAARAWNRDAAKDSEIKAAEAAVAAAKQKLKDAAAASGDTSAASTELENAQNKLGELVRKRRAADKAYDDAEKKAAEKLGELEGEGTGGVQSGDHGRVTPGPGTGDKPETSSGGVTAPGAGSPRPSGENGKRDDPSKKTAGTGTGASKPSAAPSTTPSSTKPAETEGSTATPESAAALAALLGQQQQPQAQQAAQPAASTPTASAPVASTPQSDKGKDTSQSKSNSLDKLLGPDGVIDVGDLATLGVPLTSGGTVAPASHTSTPAVAVTPTSPAAPSTPSTTGLSASSTANAQAPTSGTSATGLHTPTDVSGRSGEPRSAFSVGPETKTSAGTNTSSSAAPAHVTGARPMGAGGMPMMGPMGAMGGPGGAGRGDKDREQTVSAPGSEQSEIMHGRHSAAEAVPGGTIARGDGRRSGPPADAA